MIHSVNALSSTQGNVAVVCIQTFRLVKHLNATTIRVKRKLRNLKEKNKKKKEKQSSMSTTIQIMDFTT